MFDTVPTHMDYSGQKLAEQIFQVIIVAFGVLGFLTGYVTQQLSYAMITLCIGCVIAGLVTLPPWAMYRQDPIAWQKVETEETITQKTKSKKRN